MAKFKKYFIAFVMVIVSAISIGFGSVYVLSNSKAEVYQVNELGRKYFYNNLTIKDGNGNKTEYTLAKRFYEILEEINNSGSFISGKVSYELSEVLTSEQIKNWVRDGQLDIPKAFSAARDSFLMDHPELFYVDMYKLTISASYSNRVYSAYVDTGREATVYRDNSFKTQSEVEKAILAFDNRVKEIASEAIDRASKDDSDSFNDFKLAKAVNEIIAKETRYDFVALEGYSVDGLNPFIESMTFSSYGALVNKISVCAGYSSAYKAVLDYLNIPCVIISGYSKGKDYNGNISESDVGHSWNYVWLETAQKENDKTEIQAYSSNDLAKHGEWFAFDTTWNSLMGKGNKYSAMNATTASREHIPYGVISSSNYELTYPALSNLGYKEAINPEVVNREIEDLGFNFKSEYEYIINSDAYNVYHYISYNGKNSGELLADGLRMINRYQYMGLDGKLHWSNWSDVANCSSYYEAGSGILDLTKEQEFNDKIIESSCTFLYIAQNVYFTQYAVVKDLDPSVDADSGVIKWDKIYFSSVEEVENHLVYLSQLFENQAYGTYIAPPYILNSKTYPYIGGRVIISDSMAESPSSPIMSDKNAINFRIVYDEPLHILDESKPIGIEFISEHERARDYASFVAFQDGQYVHLVADDNGVLNILEFKFKPSLMYEHNQEGYRFIFSNVGSSKIVDKKIDGQIVRTTSDRIPNYAFYKFSRLYMACPCVFGDGRLWVDCCAQPVLADNSDLSDTNFVDENGNSTFNETLRSQMMLVAEKVSTEVENAMLNELEESSIGLAKEDIKETQTFDINLQICGHFKSIPDGSYVKIKLGFPEGYGPENEGVTFKLFHRKHIKGDEYIIEEVPCVVTKFGIVATVTSFSPYMIAVVDTDKVTSKSIYASIDGKGGKLTLEDGQIQTLTEGNSYTYTIMPDEGYSIYNVSLNGENVTDRVIDGKLTVTYEELKNNNELTIQYIAKEMVEHFVINNIVEPVKVAVSTDGEESKYDYNTDGIDVNKPIGTVTYDINQTTNGNVVATISFDKENVRVTNNDGSNTYTFTENGEFTFEFVDEAGNTGSTKAKVIWIDKIAPVASIEYSTTETTKNSVTATINFDEENVIITNNDGNNTFIFTQNGEFIFEFRDLAGNEGTAKAEVIWIDKDEIIATICYNTTEPTKENVVATISFNKENVTLTNPADGSNTYTFTENGSFFFIFRDESGNIGSAKAEVTWIDRTAPVGTITYSTTELTKGSVEVTISFDEEDVTILNNDGNNSYIFTENGEFTFEFSDKVGNTNLAVAKVTWIDNTAPVATITYNTTEPTKGQVVATISFNEENVKIINNGGKNSFTFVSNGTFTFRFKDEAGNTGSAKAEVTWIDNTAPVGTITYDITETTINNVVATISFNEENVVITNPSDGSNTHTFTKNGTFTFIFKDAVGNIGTAKAEVTWIDDSAPVVTIKYSSTEPTNKDVVATISFNKENVTIINNDGNNTFTFTENGEFTFEYRTELGNIGSAKAEVTWIDKTTPVGTIKYSITEPTKGNVEATISFDEENVIITNNNESNTYTFTENGIFYFVFRDAAGNLGTTIAEVTWIDRTAPEATITYSTTELTNESVIATISFNEENVIITNPSDGSNTYTFTENGMFFFVFKDAAGNLGSAKAEVTWIDKTIPVGKVSYSTTELTNGNVVATITFEDENIIVTNNNGEHTYTFTENGEFTFEFKNAAGNTGTVKAEVSWIDKEAPVATLTYSKTELTNGNVVVTISFDEENVIVTNPVDGSNSYTFTENGTFFFIFKDSVGNLGSVKAEVTWIDKTAPVGTISYSIDSITNGEVVAKISFNEENVTITNNDGKNEYTFAENGEFTFEFVDAAGNTGVAKAEVTWIDKTAPVGNITYNTTELTNGEVVATITFEDENIIVTNNNGEHIYTFTENGEFTFEFKNAAGNTGTAKAKVTWIDKTAPVGKIEYSTTHATNKIVIVSITFNKENVTITNNDGKNLYTFKENGEFTFEFVDALGNVGTAKAEVTWIDKTAPVATINYSTTESTKENVIVTITFDEENVTITNNDGKNTYTFTENGEFTFEFVDAAGNTGVIKANVDWIEKESSKKVAIAPIIIIVVVVIVGAIIVTILFKRKSK